MWFPGKLLKKREGSVYWECVLGVCVQHTGMFSTHTGMFGTQACSVHRHVQELETAVLDTDYGRTQTSVSLKSLRSLKVKWTCTGPASDGQTLIRGGCLYSL